MDIDRTKVCPLLLRCFWKMNRGYPLSAYKETPKDIYPSQEIQIYTWRDATLKEIGGLLKDVVESAREPGSILSFSLVFMDRNGNFDIKQVGRVFASKSGPDDSKTLDDLHFVTGDFLDIAVLPARANVQGSTSTGVSGVNNDRVGAGNGDRDRGGRDRDNHRDARRDNNGSISGNKRNDNNSNNSNINNKRIRYS